MGCVVEQRLKILKFREGQPRARHDVKNGSAQTLHNALRRCCANHYLYREAIQVHDFALIEHGGDLVGLIETTPETDALLIVNVAVEPTSQGRGVGRRLMAYAEELARSRGLMRTRLYTNKLFARNVKLYASLGYQLDLEEALNGDV